MLSAIPLRAPGWASRPATSSKGTIRYRRMPGDSWKSSATLRAPRLRPRRPPAVLQLQDDDWFELQHPRRFHIGAQRRLERCRQPLGRPRLVTHQHAFRLDVRVAGDTVAHRADNLSV